MYSPQNTAHLEKAGLFPKRVQLGPNRVGWDSNCNAVRMWVVRPAGVNPAVCVRRPCPLWNDGVYQAEWPRHAAPR
nr:AlpA family phage regulatory protein [Yoonia maricola]